MRKYLTALIVLLLAANAHAAETNLRPGLWQIETTSDLLLLVPHIPANQMQNVKDIAAEYGLEMPTVENGAAITQTCITQQMADQKTLPNFYNTQLGCSSKNATRTGNNYKSDFVCNSADFNGNGTATGTITNAQTFTGKTNITGTAQGNAVNEHADINGKWLNARCGKVKPL